jgi:integrase
VRKCPNGKILLPRMYWKNGRYYYVKQNKWTTLHQNHNDALRQYADLEAPKSSWGDLVEATYADFGTLSENTKKQYNGIRPKIVHGFSDFEPHEILGTHIYQFLEQYRSTPNMANRMLSVLKRIFTKGVILGACDFNPSAGVARFTEAKRKRYITDSEYSLIYAQANPVIKIVMEICYLTGQRIGDVLNIKRSDITEEGISFIQQKTTARLTVAMTEDLADVIRKAKLLRNVPCAWLIHPKGKASPYSYSAIKGAYQRAVKASGVQDATLHDLRAKSLTDLKKAGGNPQKLAGHRLESTTLRYLRGIESPLVTGPSLRSS